MSKMQRKGARGRLSDPERAEIAKSSDYDATGHHELFRRYKCMKCGRERIKATEEYSKTCDVSDQCSHLNRESDVSMPMSGYEEIHEADALKNNASPVVEQRNRKIQVSLNQSRRKTRSRAVQANLNLATDSRAPKLAVGIQSLNFNPNIQYMTALSAHTPTAPESHETSTYTYVFCV